MGNFDRHLDLFDAIFVIASIFIFRLSTPQLCKTLCSISLLLSLSFVFPIWETLWKTWNLAVCHFESPFWPNYYGPEETFRECTFGCPPYAFWIIDLLNAIFFHEPSIFLFQTQHTLIMIKKKTYWTKL